MGDSQQPKPAAPEFEVPDLVLEPAPRSKCAAAELSAPQAPRREQDLRNLFDEDTLGADGAGIDLALDGEPNCNLHFGAGSSFDDPTEIDLQTDPHSGLSIDTEVAPPAARRATTEARAETALPLPGGRRPTAHEQSPIDALELARLAGYDEPPKSAHLTPLYAYRVFKRQREIKRVLVGLVAERRRAEAQRDHALADLGSAVRPDAERSEPFQRLVAPLIELERVQSQHGQAMSMVNAELAARASAIDDELLSIAEQLGAERARERDTQQRYDERQVCAHRAEAKLKRAQIEIRAAGQLADQKLGPQSGVVPEPETAQVATLRERALALEPEVKQAKAELAQALADLERASARVAAAERSERLGTRKKQALVQRYQQDLDLRGQGQSESEQRRRAALAELGRAVLGARGALSAPEACLDRARSATEHADALLAQCELHARAALAYDHARVAHGVRLACTFAVLCVALLALKFAL